MTHPLLTKWLADILQPDAHALQTRAEMAAEAIAKNPAIADRLEAALDVCQTCGKPQWSYVSPDGTYRLSSHPPGDGLLGHPFVPLVTP